ncbi:hypothetical protein F2Q70_00035110 [Brassica cretica]|uniref:Uncharacterized protein n=1 Tax=Brassica cretica TaxID=69181 RepID=A0A8S9K0B0_BRACR|nr:hypothetical protein F2Q70_00035110 [Brassica cretica]
MRKEKKAKASEVRRLQCQIQSQEEQRTLEPAGTVVPRDEFHARLTRMAVLFDSLMAVRKKDLALVGLEGGLGDFDSILSLLKSECTLTPCLEETEGQGRAAEEGEGDAVERGDGEVAEGGDGDAVPSSDDVEDEGGATMKTEGQGRAAEEGEGNAVERGDGEVAEGGDGNAVPSSDEAEDENGAPRSA